ncbi:hypothetical protein V7152_13455 [Neobacillus drentensis]|uniref:hypothetical protein n=1 Tax=Neobacillus drentensis TaxID=220684 RepID=UPI003000237E
MSSGQKNRPHGFPEPSNEKCIRGDKKVQVGDAIHFVTIHEDESREECDLIFKDISDIEDKRIIHFNNDSLTFDLHISNKETPPLPKENSATQY